VHRVAQLVSHVRARVEPGEEEAARRLLPPSAFELFASMPVADRRHALDVAERLASAGHDDLDLLAAALLHDAAKGHRMRLWHRVAGVLLESLAPAGLRALASPDSRSWRHGFHLYLEHGTMSARLAVEAGCSPRAGGFMRGEAAKPDLPLLRALTVADDAG